MRISQAGLGYAAITNPNIAMAGIIRVYSGQRNVPITDWQGGLVHCNLLRDPPSLMLWIAGLEIKRKL